MAGKSIEQLKKEIASLEKKNKELEEKKKLEQKLSALKESTKPKKTSGLKGTRRKVRSLLGPVGDSFDRAFG